MVAGWSQPGGMAMRRGIKLFFDGGYRPLPLGMETAVVVQGQAHIRRNLGPGSSMDAEWLALIHAVEIARELHLANPVFLGDALAVIGQATGAVKTREAYVQHRQALAEFSAPLRIRYIKRTQNLAGIALARGGS